MIVLVGFMGAGKTTVGRLLARRLGLPFVDTDEAIETSQGRTIAELFEAFGEPRFREIEAAVVSATLAGGNAVVSLGGGAPEDPSIRESLANHTVVHLAVPLEQALQRIDHPKSRPKLQSNDVEQLFSARSRVYSAVADITIDTAHSSAAEVVEEMASLLCVERIPVATPSRTYEVVVGNNILARAAELAGAPQGAAKAVVVTHPRLKEYAQVVGNSYTAAGLEVTFLEVPEGEGSKSLDTLGDLLAAFARYELHRKDVVVSVGGGVITDLGGFASSIYNRGIDHVAVPTSLLAQVDAAIGGKTGINLPAGKNLVGTFHQPRAVLADLACLETLPEAEFRSALAEVAKYGFIADEDIIGFLEEDFVPGSHPDLAQMVGRCVAIKAAVVASDEREAGTRAVLNYGHTFGHAIEATAGYGAVRHGEAISLGMMMAAHLAEDMGLAGPGLVAKHEVVLERLGLPVRAEVEPVRLVDAMKVDKKRQGGIRFVLLRAVGDPVVGVEAEQDAVLGAIGKVSR